MLEVGSAAPVGDCRTYPIPPHAGACDLARTVAGSSKVLDRYPVFTSMLEVMTTKSDVLHLIEQRGALKDSELASLLGIAHQQVNQAARGLAAAGAIRRVPGPDGVIRNYLETAGMPPARVQGTPGRDEVSPSPRASPVLGRIVAGTPVSRNHLTRLGFVEHALVLVTDADVPEGGLIGWDTLGSVPDAPGLYCFVGQKNPSNELRVFYVGMTSHLWMVTKGQLPGGIARGGQRYGRPKHAGTTRQRVNAEVARLSAGGWTFSHWLRAVEASTDPATLKTLLLSEEASLIAMWDLRVVGWNRG
jgi:hypothetical protein